MNHSDDSKIAALKWKYIRLYDGENIFHIPSERTLLELINAPILDRVLASNILSQYELTPDIRHKTNTILEINKPDSLWKEISSIIVDTDLKVTENKSLYIFFSLQKYRLAQEPIDTESVETLAKYSNYLVDCLNNELQILSSSDQGLKDFLTSKGYDWNFYIYSKLATIYFHNIFPFPLRVPPNTDKDYAVNAGGTDGIYNEYKKILIEREMRKTENRTNQLKLSGEMDKVVKKLTTLSLKDRILETHSNHTCASERWRQALFTDYFYLEKYTIEVELSITQEYPEFLSRSGRKALDNISREKRASGGNRQKPRLFQCQFCYRYRLEDIHRNGKYSVWHCPKEKSPKCEKRYKAWNQHLISLRPTPIHLSKAYQ